MDNRPRSSGRSLIAAIIVIAVVAAICYFVYILYSRANEDIVIQRCPVGLCKFDVITGEKRCPASAATEGIQIDFGKEFCTSRNYCQNVNFPCALQLDGTVDCSGICGLGNNGCKCLATNS